ncbi:MAG: hypothetical protein JW895_00860 [Thermoleophilaceae bacterium]|nr:hypothetical protein [Thermoleophilaceae bacterium]
MTTSSIPSTATNSSRPRHLWAGVLPWIGVILFVVHAAGVVSSQPEGWHQDVVQLGVAYMIGVAGLAAGISHLVFSNATARSIGWQTSPFQWEVGCANAAFGVAGLMASGYDSQFWLAVIVMSGLFRIGCGVGHIRQIITERNFAINNTAILGLNFGVPIFLFLLWQAWG